MDPLPVRKCDCAELSRAVCVARRVESWLEKLYVGQTLLGFSDACFFRGFRRNLALLSFSEVAILTLKAF